MKKKNTHKKHTKQSASKQGSESNLSKQKVEDKQAFPPPIEVSKGKEKSLHKESIISCLNGKLGIAFVSILFTLLYVIFPHLRLLKDFETIMTKSTSFAFDLKTKYTGKETKFQDFLPPNVLQASKKSQMEDSPQSCDNVLFRMKVTKATLTTTFWIVVSIIATALVYSYKVSKALDELYQNVVANTKNTSKELESSAQPIIVNNYYGGTFNTHNDYATFVTNNIDYSNNTICNNALSIE